MDAKHSSDQAKHQDTGRPAAAPKDSAERSERIRGEGVPDPPGRLGAGDAAGVATWAWRTIVVLACVTLVLLIAGEQQTDVPNEPTPPDSPRPDDIGPIVGLDADDAAREFAAREFAAREFARCLCDDGRSSLVESGQTLHDGIEAVFDPIYATRIPEFLDWHYSVVGQYTELGLAAAGRLEREITRRLFADLDDGIRKASEAIERMQAAEMRAAVTQCIEDQVQILDADDETRWLRARMLEAAIPETLHRLTISAGLSSTVAVGTGLAGGLGIKALTKKLITSVAVKTAGKATVKGAGTIGAAAAGAGAGAALGPIGAAVGGIVGGLAAWWGVDLGAVKLDERFTREQLEEALTALVDERRSEVREAVSEAIATRLQVFDTVCGPPPDETAPEALGPVTPADITARR